MMKYYIEIRLIDEIEIGLDFLWQKLYTQIHLALVEQGEGHVGVSFPKYGDSMFPLGDTLRLFAESEEALAALNIKKWLARLIDYLEIMPIQKVPDTVSGYALFTRKQVKTGKERQARRYAKRHNISYEEALKKYSVMEEKVSTLPFVMMQSLSSGQEMKLFIQKSAVETQTEGEFNSYGLSLNASVPCF
jgi:CRISPR-associated endonuclease Csy4